MAVGSFTVSGSVLALLTGSKAAGPITFASTAASPATTPVVLANGANTITVPTGATAVLIVFSPASSVTKTIKGVGGDTGIQVATTGMVLLTFQSGSVPASFVITTSGADTGNTTEILFI